jgi:hypothetical protein
MTEAFVQALATDVAQQVLAKVEAARAVAGQERLAYSEREAAALLGLKWYQLRDERLHGRIASSKVVGDPIRYMREDLIAYQMRSRNTP